MATGLIDIVKRASLEAMDNAQMADLRYGKVINVSPLKVKITDQFILPESLLVVPEHLTNYKVNITTDWETNPTENHKHNITGTKTITINNALKVGDNLALLRQQGGQGYFILDRI